MEKEHTTSVTSVKVSQIRPKYTNLKKWMDDPMNVYIGRRGIVFIDNDTGTSKIRWPPSDSIWHNPYKISGDMDREDVLKLYENYITKKLEQDEKLVKVLLSLQGKKLGCWCSPDPCHGDILVNLIDKFSSK